MQRRTYVGLVLSAALVGCTERDSQSAENDGQDEPSTQQSGTTDSRLTLSVGRSETTTEITLGEDTPLVPQSESRLVFVEVVAKNPTDAAVKLPQPDRFTVAAGTETQDPYQVTFQDDPNGVESTINEPVSGPLFPPTAKLASGSEITGWLVSGVPTDATAATLQRRTAEGNVSKKWSLSVEG